MTLSFYCQLDLVPSAANAAESSLQSSLQLADWSDLQPSAAACELSEMENLFRLVVAGDEEMAGGADVS